MSFMGDIMSPEPLWQNGPAPGAFYNFPANSSNYGRNNHISQDFTSHSALPITTTTTVIGVKFDKGCVIAGDTLGSYGSLARFRNCPRVTKVNDLILLGSSGDYADYQYLKDIIDQKIIYDECLGDGLLLKPRSLHSWLTRTSPIKVTHKCSLIKIGPHYTVHNENNSKISKYTFFVIFQDDEPFLGTVDKLGTAYEDAAIATGIGAYMVTPLLRSATEHGNSKIVIDSDVGSGMPS
ncbi:Proteasome subunit beta type [Operophtera brumata]|uniref:Proteasome subunit beta n=1 Tax=Operophtera brumata TaxID=104452 RepID=A0A0L7LH29_OPEBR|nr:Proteasome subunit beta type [Operophtera brumata]